MNNHRKYLEPEVLSQLSNISLVARLVVEGFITGLHKSPYHGFSVEFAEHRQYMPGDEIKRIDWKVYGKTDRFYVKEYEEETNLKCYILLDISGSMKYSSGGISKIEYGSYLAASLSYLMLKQRDATGLALYSDRIKKFIPPRSVWTYLNRILTELENVVCEDETSTSVTFHELAERINRRGLIIIISDLIDDMDEVLKALRHFRHRKHEVLVFHVLDKKEINFDFPRSGIFRDIETGEEINTQPWHIREDYSKQVQQFIDFYRKNCRDNLIDYIPVNTSTPYDKVLMEYLVKRKMLG